MKPQTPLQAGEKLLPLSGHYLVADDRYQISSFGRVFNIQTGHFIASYARPSKETKNREDNYQWVKLASRDGKGDSKGMVSVPVHRLVAFVFLPNPQGKTEVDHINGRRDDNRVENLRWATRKENEFYKRQKNPEAFTSQLQKCHEAAWAKCSFETKVWVDDVLTVCRTRKEAAAVLGITDRVLTAWMGNPVRIPGNVRIHCKGIEYTHGNHRVITDE